MNTGRQDPGQPAAAAASAARPGHQVDPLFDTQTNTQTQTRPPRRRPGRPAAAGSACAPWPDLVRWAGGRSRRRGRPGTPGTHQKRRCDARAAQRPLGRLTARGALLGPARRPQGPSRRSGLRGRQPWPTPRASEGPSAPPVHVEGGVLMHLVFLTSSPLLLGSRPVQGKRF